ncbi:hypothetical protein ACIOJG_00035 [Streptomyces anulatus]
MKLTNLPGVGRCSASPGCPVRLTGCGELAAVRSRARAVGDMTTVSDCNVYLRRHPQGHE